MQVPNNVLKEQERNVISLEQLQAFDHPLPLVGKPVFRRRFELNVNIENGFDFIGYRAEIKFDTESLGYYGVDYGDYLQMQGRYHPDTSWGVPPVRISIVPKDAEHDKLIPSYGDGLLATLTFESPYPKPKPARITLSSIVIITRETLTSCVGDQQTIDIVW